MAKVHMVIAYDDGLLVFNDSIDEEKAKQYYEEADRQNKMNVLYLNNKITSIATIQATLKSAAEKPIEKDIIEESMSEIK